jgi:hypothetical protein
MRLRIKIPLLFLAVVIAFIVIIHLILTYVVLKSYVDLESQEAIKVSERLQQSVQDRISTLDSKSGDWSNWDDAYNFVTNKNQEFINSNIQNATFVSLKINFMIFYNATGSVVFGQGYDNQNKKTLPLPPFFLNQDSQKFFTAGNFSQTRLGLVNIDGKIMYIVFKPILTSNGTGPSRGMLLFGRYLDAQEVKDLAAIQKNPLEYHIYSDPKLPWDFKDAKKYLTTNKGVYLLRESEKILGTYTLFYDIYQKPVIIFEDTINRDIYQYGKKNTYITEAFLVIFGAGVALLMLVLLLNRLILSRLAHLTNEVKKIGPSGSLSLRVSSFGKDELGILADEFNKTLGNLESATQAKIFEEQRSQSLLGIIEEAVIITNANNTIVYANRACENFFGYKKTEMINKLISELFDVFDKKEKPLDKSFLQQLITNPQSKDRVTIYIKGKSDKLAVIVTCSEITVENAIRGKVYVFHNITAEVELDKQKDDFFSIASHELRTPLSVISGSLDNIIQGYGKSVLSEVDIQAIKNALSSSDRLTRLVNDYLNVSRLDQGRVTLNIKPVDIDTLINAVQTEMTPLFTKRGLGFKFICDKNHEIVKADEDKLKEVLINLIGNSLKFTEQGEISITHAVKDNMLVTEVTDTGIGIAHDKQHLLFARFQQAMDNTISRKAEGTGLGLYISREFVRLMGGDMVLAKSEPGVGSTFSFTLPFNK